MYNTVHEFRGHTQLLLYTTNTTTYKSEYACMYYVEGNYMVVNRNIPGGRGVGVFGNLTILQTVTNQYKIQFTI